VSAKGGKRMSGKNRRPGRDAWLNVVAAGLYVVAIAATAGSPGSTGETVATGDPAGCIIVTGR